MIPREPFQVDPMIEAAQRALPPALGIKLQTMASPDQDGWGLQVRWPEGQITLQINGKQIHRAEDLGMLRAQTPDLERTVLLTPYLTAHLARKCLDLDIQFLDTVGNAYLRTPGLLLCLIGNKAPLGAALPDRPKPFKGFNRKGLHTVFGLLAGEGLIRAPYREIGKAVGVATGTVGEVMADLLEAGIVLQKTDGRILLQRDRLREGWLANYAYKLRPHLNPTRYRAMQPDWWKTVTLDPQDAQWGGEVAADRLTGHLQPGRATLYTALPHGTLTARLRLRPDPQGDVEILDRFWTFPNPEGYPADLVPALLVYADLIASGDPRNADLARMIHDHHLAP